MPIITITSDWSGGDFYLGNLKARLMSLNSETNFADINHFIKPFNSQQCAFILKATYRNFPKGTIHLVCVNSQPSEVNQIWVVVLEEQYFVGSQSVLGLLMEDEAPESFKINHEKLNLDDVNSGYLYLDEMVKHIIDGTLEDVGVKEGLRPFMVLQPAVDEDVITGNVIYVDAYKNGITNITEELFKQVGRNREFTIYVKSNHNKIEQISTKYTDEPTGELLAVFNSLGYLEIAMNMGNVSEILNLDNNSVVRINFKNKAKDKLF